MQTTLPPHSRLPAILPAGRTLIRTVSSVLRSLDMDVPVADVPPGPPPWLLPTPEVSYTPTSKSDLPSLQLQLALEHLATVTSAVASPCRIYTDGSLQSSARRCSGWSGFLA